MSAKKSLTTNVGLTALLSSLFMESGSIHDYSDFKEEPRHDGFKSSNFLIVDYRKIQNLISSEDVEFSKEEKEILKSLHGKEKKKYLKLLKEKYS